MKKVFSIILVILFLINDFSYISVYLPLMSLSKYLYTEFDESDIDNTDITTFQVPKEDYLNGIGEIIRLNDKEFVYRNEMYDICVIKESNDNLILYCVKDLKETSLNNLFASRFGRKGDNNINLALRNIFYNKRFSGFLSLNVFNLTPRQISSLSIETCFRIFTPYIKIDSPPPKFS